MPKGEESNEELAEIKRTRCSKCLQEVSRGISHPCSCVSKKRNLVDLVRVSRRVNTRTDCSCSYEKIAIRTDTADSCHQVC